MARLYVFLSTVMAVFWVLGGIKATISFLYKLRQHKQITGKWLATVAFLFMVMPAEAQEARCNELGGNCVCSEPFQMTGFTNTSGSFWNPNDSTTKQCGEEVANHPITRNDSDLEAITAADDATAFARMPSGNSVVRIFRATPGNSGTFFVGGWLTSANLGATYNARMSIRAYVYHSTDYNFRDEEPPCHSKFLQGQVGAWHIENAFGSLEMYQFTNGNWGPGSAFPRDCCNALPGVTTSPPDHAEWKGHWFFTEVVVTNRSGPGIRFQLYMRDVTNGVTKWNNGNEALLVDWYGTADGVDDWDSSFNTAITSSPRQVPMSFNYYREVGAGDCNGWRGLSHMMIAGWDTDAGQRIGASTEFEGSGTFRPTVMMFRDWAGLILTVGSMLVSLMLRYRHEIASVVVTVSVAGSQAAVITATKAKQLSYNATLTTVQGVTKVMEKVKRGDN